MLCFYNWINKKNVSHIFDWLLFNVNKIEVQLHIYDKNKFINNISTCSLKGGNWFDIWTITTMWHRDRLIDDDLIVARRHQVIHMDNILFASWNLLYVFRIRRGRYSMIVGFTHCLCNLCLSPQQLWVPNLLMARCTRLFLMW